MKNMAASSAPKLLIIISNGPFFLSHRLPIATAAQEAGFEVAVACPEDTSREAILAYGFRHLPFVMRRGSATPFSEIAALAGMAGAIREFRPDVIHFVTSKPIIYGGIVARLLGIPAVSSISGLGYVFIGKGFKLAVMRALVVLGYRFSLSRRRSIAIFQNKCDLGLFQRLGILGSGGFRLIPGSGVDLKAIRPAPLPDGPTVVALPARLLRDKGVVEFVEAARILRSEGTDCVFRLIGDPDPGNPTSVTLQELTRWQEEGVVEVEPYTRDIGAALALCHIVALPSYREGFPKTLIDAAAAGRACATSDVPGCRDAVVPGQTGILFPPRDGRAMADALRPLVTDRQRQAAMGAAARTHAEIHFAIRDVVNKNLSIYRELVSMRSPRGEI
jgi:glycosyltransferase involved in cell wall biosynthesis